MGISVGYSEIIIPKLLLNVAYVLYSFTTAVCYLLRLLGFGEFPETEASWVDETIPARLEPVTSSVSAQRIREQLPVVRFGVLAIEPEDVLCVVCLNNMERHEDIRRLTNCSHIFHRVCLDKWLDHQQTTCPLCRSSLLSEGTGTEMGADLGTLAHGSNLSGNLSAVLLY